MIKGVNDLKPEENEEFELLELAWGVIANAGAGNWPDISNPARLLRIKEKTVEKAEENVVIPHHPPRLYGPGNPDVNDDQSDEPESEEEE